LQQMLAAQLSLPRNESSYLELDGEAEVTELCDCGRRPYWS
jgi:hypothetical protein